MKFFYKFSTDLIPSQFIHFKDKIQLESSLQHIDREVDCFKSERVVPKSKIPTSVINLTHMKTYEQCE